MTSTADMSFDRRGHLFPPLVISLLLHSLFAFMVLQRVQEPISNPLDVEFLSPEEMARRERGSRPEPPPPAAAPEPQVEAPPAPKNQIVSPPDSPEAIPDRARLLSDRNSRAEKETVKKGEPAPPAKPPQEVARRTERDAPEPREQSAQAGERAARGESDGREKLSKGPMTLPGLSDLFVKPSELAAKDPSLARGQVEGRDRARKSPGAKQEELASIARPELWADPGERGTPDYLPDVRNGEFTLLNTKADRFAPFVRRVALRVFQTFSMDLKSLLYTGSVPQGRETIEVEAVMSKDGKKLEVFLKNRDGNLSTDRVLLATLRDQIFFDDNPPPSAVADDGHIHFLFALNTAVWYGRDDRGQIRPGAHWLFQAGLL